MKKMIPFLSMALLSLFLLATMSSDLAVADELIRIGVLAKRGPDTTLTRWEPTANSLGTSLPGKQFTIVPLKFSEINAVIENRQVEFILVNTAIYITLEMKYGVSRIVTMKNETSTDNCSPENITTRFGGVIFTRADNDKITTIETLQGKTFAAVDETSFGGWQMAWYAIRQQGIDPRRDFIRLDFSGTHDAVVYAVRDNKAEAGTVRTDTLERMAKEGKIDLADFKIINARSHPNFAPVISTDLYPEWPFSKLPHTSMELAHQVAIALMKVSPESRAARIGHLQGWTIPLDYLPVHTLMRTLEIGPYTYLGDISPAKMIKQYWYWMVLALLAFVTTWAALIYYYRLKETLEEKKEQAESANKAKSLFLANMTHELYTPLHAILGFSEMMASSQEISPAEKKNLEIVSQNGRLLLGRIGELLNMSNLESGQLQLHLEAVDLFILAEQLRNSFQEIAESKGLQYRLEKQMEYTGYIMADLSKLRHVLHNILSNAFKFTIKGGVTLTLQSRPAVSTDRVQLRFEVSDTGSGIAGEDLQRIFEPFVQVGEPAVQTGMWGTGLGLSVSRRFVEMMGGNIEVESKLGKGTLFRIDIEVQSAPQQEGESSKTSRQVDLSHGINNESLQEADSDGTKVLPTPDIKALPIEFLNRLMGAAEVGDGVEALALINTLEEEHGTVSCLLTRLVKEYRYDQLVVMIQEALEREK